MLRTWPCKATDSFIGQSAGPDVSQMYRRQHGEIVIGKCLNTGCMGSYREATYIEYLILRNTRHKRREFWGIRRQCRARSGIIIVAIGNSIRRSVRAVMTESICQRRGHVFNVLIGLWVELSRQISVVLSRWITLVKRKHPLLPLVLGAQTILSILAKLVIGVLQLAGGVTQQFVVFSEVLDPFEAGNESQAHETLRVHVFTEIQVLAEIIHREIVFPIYVKM
jgi:hypothetical protein